MTPDQPVQRFTQWCAHTHKHGLNKHEHGELVRYEDYAALLREREALRAALVEIAESGHDHTSGSLHEDCIAIAEAALKEK